VSEGDGCGGEEAGAGVDGRDVGVRAQVCGGRAGQGGGVEGVPAVAAGGWRHAQVRDRSVHVLDQPGGAHAAVLAPGGGEDQGQAARRGVRSAGAVLGRLRAALDPGARPRLLGPADAAAAPLPGLGRRLGARGVVALPRRATSPAPAQVRGLLHRRPPPRRPILSVSHPKP
jgi:hypothetical protein